MEENVDFVSFSGGDNSYWSFFIRGDARKISEEYSEILNITKKLMDITAGFFKPQEIDYAIEFFPEDINPYYIVVNKKMHSERVLRQIRSEGELYFGDIAEDVQKVNIADRQRYISGFYFDGKTRFVLNGRDEYIDNRSKGLYALYDNYQVIDPDPQTDPSPLSMKIVQSNLRDVDEKVTIADPAYYEIFFESYTNMWFVDTEIGHANREKLKSIFTGIKGNFNVVDTAFLSDHFTDSVLGKN